MFGMPLMVIVAVVAAGGIEVGPPDDSDMHVERRQPAEADNGFFDLDIAALDVLASRVSRYADMHIGYSWHEDEDEDDEPHEVDGPTWDEPQVSALLANAAPIFHGIDRCLERPDFVVPPRAAGSNHEYAYRWCNAVYWVVLRMTSRMHSGDSRGIVEDALRLMRVGQRIEGSQGDVIADSAFSKRHGLWWIGHLARQGLLSRTRCVNLAHELDRFETTKEAVQTAMRERYRYICAQFDSPERLPGVVPLRRWAFQPNRTRRLLLETTRRLIEAQEHTGGVKLELETSSTSILNCDGEQLHDAVAPWIATIAAEPHDANFLLRATRILLALRAHHIDHGVLPEELVALVPEYLDAVPRDPWDGQPLRYSAERLRVWSVGNDGADDGGSDDCAHGLHHQVEPTLCLPRW